MGERYTELLEKQDFEMISAFKQTYIDALKQYYFVGKRYNVLSMIFNLNTKADSCGV